MIDGGRSLIAMRGLPRSGKSTIARQLSKDLGAPIVSRDALRLALYGERFRKEGEPMVKAMSRYMIEALFGAGHDTVIVDETNLSKEAIKGLQGDWVVYWYPVNTEPTVCVYRAHETGQDDLIPVIWSMAERWEPLPEGTLLYKP